MSAEVRKKLVCRKREAELQRVLLPDAPPSKRQLRRPSPVREACPLLPVEEPAVEPAVGAVGEPADEEPADEPAMENWKDLYNMDVVVVGEEVAVEIQPGTSQSNTQDTGLRLTLVTRTLRTY